MNTVDISPTKSFSNLYDKINTNLGKSFNSSNILIFITILILFSLLFSNLGGNSNVEMSPVTNNSGTNILEKAGGLHKFMNWNKPILTDSGGYQIMSLSNLNKIDKDIEPDT